MGQAFSAVVKSSGIVFVGLVLRYLLGFGSLVAISRYLGPEKFGTIAASLTLVLFVASLLRLGLDNGIARFIPRYDDSAEQFSIVLTGLLIGVPLSLLTSILLFFNSEVLAVRLLRDSDATNILMVFSFLIIPFVIVQLSVATARGLNRTLPRLLTKDITYPLAKLFGFLYVITVGGSVLDFSYVYVFSYALAAVIGLYFIKQSVAWGSLQTSVARDMVTFSFPLLLSGIMYKVLSDIDTLLLSYYSATSGPVGVYNVVYPLAAMLLIIPQSTGYLAMPVLSNLDANRETAEFRDTYQLIMKWTTIAGIPVVVTFIVFSGPIIAMIYGVEYREGAMALVLLVLGFFSHIVAGPNADSLEALGHSRLLLTDGILVAIANIGLNIVLIPLFSIEGAALATALSYLFRNVLIGMQIYDISDIICIPRRVTPVFAYGFASLLFLLWLKTSIFNLSNTLLAVPLLSVLVLCYTLVVLRTAVRSHELALLDSVEERYKIDMHLLRRFAKDGDE